jgi:hypothetical protein
MEKATELNKFGSLKQPEGYMGCKSLTKQKVASLLFSGMKLRLCLSH